MSKVLDQDKNIVNAPAPQTTDGAGKNRYSPDGLTIDWFATHPRADVKKIVVTDGVPAFISDPEANAKIDEIAQKLGDATQTDEILTEAANEIAPSNSDGASV